MYTWEKLFEAKTTVCVPEKWVEKRGKESKGGREGWTGRERGRDRREKKRRKEGGGKRETETEADMEKQAKRGRGERGRENFFVKNR